MTETTPEDAAAKRASEQARLRKERREAKIRAGGASRLDKITGLGGRAPDGSSATSSPAPSTTASPAPTKQAAAPPPPAASADHADPDEVDISQHYYEPTATPRIPPGAGTDPNALSEAQLRQMMLGFERPPPGGDGGGGPPSDFQNPFAAMAGMGAGGGAPGEEDPMMKMLSQMMAGGGFPGGDGGAGGSPFPPGFPGMPGMQGQGQGGAAASSADYLWRVLHAVFAVTLGLYIVLTTHFSGARAQRERTALALSYPAASDEAVGEVNRMEAGREVFFWMFATAEALLITTRLMLQKGRPAEAGLVWTVVAFLPGPWRGWAETALRYANVFASVRRDILVCVFVLGVVAWVRG